MFDDAGAQPRRHPYGKGSGKAAVYFKTDLRDNYPYGLFAVPMDEVVRIHASARREKRPSSATASDLALWDECVARALTRAGGTREGHRAGLLRLRPVHRRTGPARRGRAHRRDGHPRRPATPRGRLRCCRITGRRCSAARRRMRYIGETLEKNHIPLSTIHLKAGLFWRRAVDAGDEGRKSKSGWASRAYDIYGLSEISGRACPSAATARTGCTSTTTTSSSRSSTRSPAVLPDGEKGRGRVHHADQARALPAALQHARHLSITHERALGRTLTRMARIAPRPQICSHHPRVNVFPSQIESVLLSVGQVEPYYMILVDRVNNLDVMEIKGRTVGGRVLRRVRHRELEAKIRASIESTLGIRPRSHSSSRRRCRAARGQAKRVIDNRTLR